MPGKAAIFTLGCRTNQYDEVIIARNLMDAGFAIVPFDEPADLYVINTCTVTHRADADSRKAARKALKLNPNAFIVIAGCYPQRSVESLVNIEGIDLIVGNRHKYNISDFLPDPLKKIPVPQIEIDTPESGMSFGDSVQMPISRTRALLKIQDGCDHFCSYCIVPHVRGKPRSLDRHEVLSRIGQIAAEGYKEIVLTGIHLGIWGRDHGDSLPELIRAFDNLDGEFRIRLSSIEPMELTNELIDLIMSSPRICRHLHIPIQSASDEILGSMGRPYDIATLERLFDRIKGRDSGWNIGTDLIVGYPLESDQYFDEQVRALNKLKIDYFHIFTYSPRAGTEASLLKPVFHQDSIKSRLECLKSIDRKARENFLKSQDCKILVCIIEQSIQRKKDIIYGLTDNYLKVKINNIKNSGAIVTGMLRINDLLNPEVTVINQ